ncbi:PREDICTED: WD repeat-containing protein 86 isoform X1 [Hipposideros armiger]|uniref:WD repeat-containing protein 86 isoform X1 n=1 Tax=Hipposideros armiger TaxID=186990 RepID=A0A8B7SE15_HIPAR|nr:PREDICTED: WD repeat-containing protein 86 isoform X1 [Hipposideros armiger]XP_019510974.1 PREDICTED: WD repeat-containing protein 86 isoform X1 [Hipposideros armiger]XP_019510975.1 PREDICTED: WD repeat-containing protein 86 isoform X1 [Hipposideros armiger]XP_019510976.1 PREDICTED: WD repeat-containing protein 86 isoform X1 [Hipposideros armiger]
MGGGGSALRVCAEHRGGINWLSLSPDGQRLLTGSEDGTARLWSTADGQCCALLQGHESYVTFCQLENEAAFTCSADCTIRKWDVLTGQCLQVFRGHTSIVNRILVANNQLFSSSYDRTARAWSVDKGQVSREFRGHRNCVLTLAYSAPWDLPGAPFEEEAVAGGLLVTGSTDGTAKVWQVASGCCHQTLRGHTGAVLCLVLDTPSHTAFTGSTDTTIRAWDILSGEQLRVFREHQGSVICLELVNRHVYSGSADRTAKCWLVDTGESVRTFTAHRHSVSALKYHAGTCKWPWPPPSPRHPSLLYRPCRCLSLSLLSPQQVLPGQGLSASLLLLRGPFEPQLPFRMVSAAGQRPCLLRAASLRVIYKEGLNKAVGMPSHIDPPRTCSSEPACSEVLGSRAHPKDTF